MNRLAGRRTGFSLGSNVKAHTKGIWMWCVPHPHQPGHTLVLLDTEGLGDVEKGDTKNDAWIFVLAVLLSSTLIYNSKGTIDRQALENLHYVLTLAERVKLTKSPGQSGAQPPTATGLAAFFPTFVWAVRDFTLQLEADGKELSEDEYLENALELRGGSSPEAERYDRLRECIRQFFPERRCFVFDQPASKKDLPHLEELPDDRMDPEFLRQLEKFCSYIWERSQPKSIPGGCNITGQMLGTLAVTYVDAIQSGAVPCLESAVTALAELHNSAAVREAAALYRELLEQRAELPVETAEELQELHERCQRETLQLFAERAITDDVERFRAELLRQVEAARRQFCSRDEEASHEMCRGVLQELSRETEQCIKDGGYFVPGGHQLFLGDQQALVERYRALPGKGVKADAVLQEFLQSKEPLSMSICSTDRALREKDELIKGLQAQNVKAEQEREAERKREAEKLRQMQDRVHGYEKAKQEWEAERKREAEKLQQTKDGAHCSEEEAPRLRKRLLEDKEKKSHSEGGHSGGGFQKQDSRRNWAGVIIPVLGSAFVLS
uniref:Guanylate binding protein family member 6 n=1 Tax=Pavo cristatus TaxID=9049 RepID=A0A8C9FMX6_PAVCR